MYPNSVDLQAGSKRHEPLKRRNFTAQSTRRPKRRSKAINCERGTVPCHLAPDVKPPLSYSPGWHPALTGPYRSSGNHRSAGKLLSFGLAGDFDRMASEFTNLFTGFGVTARFSSTPQSRAAFVRPPLDSSWAFSGTEISAGDAYLRAGAIAAAIEGAASQLESNAAPSDESRDVTTSYGNPTGQGLRR